MPPKRPAGSRVVQGLPSPVTYPAPSLGYDYALLPVNHECYDAKQPGRGICLRGGECKPTTIFGVIAQHAQKHFQHDRKVAEAKMEGQIAPKKRFVSSPQRHASELVFYKDNKKNTRDTLLDEHPQCGWLGFANPNDTHLPLGKRELVECGWTSDVKNKNQRRALLESHLDSHHHAWTTGNGGVGGPDWPCNNCKSFQKANGFYNKEQLVAHFKKVHPALLKHYGSRPCTDIEQYYAKQSMWAVKRWTDWDDDFAIDLIGSKTIDLRPLTQSYANLAAVEKRAATCQQISQAKKAKKAAQMKNKDTSMERDEGGAGMSGSQGNSKEKGKGKAVEEEPEVVEEPEWE